MKYSVKLMSLCLVLFMGTNIAKAQWNSGTNIQHTDDQVGIGTDSPDQKLTIVGTGEDVSHYSYSSDMPKSSPNYKFYRARGTNLAPLIVTDSIEFGSLIWYGYNGSAFKAGAELVTVLDGTPSGNHMPSKLIFRTSSSGGFVDRMVLDANGRMGINLSAPDEKLHVDGNIKQEPGQTLITDNISANSNASTLLKLDNGTWATGASSIASKSRVSIGLDYNNNGTNGEFIIGTNDEDPTGANWTSLFTIKESGDVGIGISQPTSTLHVEKNVALASGEIFTHINSKSALGSSDGDILVVETARGDTHEQKIIQAKNSVNEKFYIKADGSGYIASNLSVGLANEDSVETTVLSLGVRNNDTSLFEFKSRDDGGKGYSRFHTKRYGVHHTWSRGSNDGEQTIAKLKSDDNVGSRLELYDYTTENVNALISSNGDSYFNGGNVGFGTSTPNFKLHVDKKTVNTSAALFEFANSLDPAGGGTGLILRNNNTTDNSISSIKFEGNDPGGNVRHMAQIVVGKEPNWQTGTTSSYNSYLAFWTRNGGPQEERIRITADGKVGIGTSTPDEMLTVNGKIHAEKVKVSIAVPAPDYVFEDDYDLMSLENTSKYIKENKHLPNVPSGVEMEENGVEVGEMNMILLRKVEELTLYILDQNNKIKDQDEKINTLLEKVESLEQGQ